jgi:hypothetical protein
MADIKEQHFDCSQCKTVQKIELIDSVNAAEQPALAELVKKHELFMHECSVCGHKTETLYPFLYHDPANKLMVYFVPSTERDIQELAGEAITFMNEAIGATLLKGSNSKVSEDYEYRIVATYTELLEKIYARELGLDDRILEATKLYYLGQLGSQAPMESLIGFFLVPDEGTPVFSITFSDEREGTSAFHRSVYDELATDFAERITDDAAPGFRVVDQSWAMAIYPKLIGVNEADLPTEGASPCGG